MFLIFPETEGREICAPHEQVVCVSESFILTLGKEEIFGSWKLHLPSHQFITGDSVQGGEQEGGRSRARWRRGGPLTHVEIRRLLHTCQDADVLQVGRQGALTLLSCVLHVCFAPARRAGRSTAKSAEAEICTLLLREAGNLRESEG